MLWVNHQQTWRFFFCRTYTARFSKSSDNCCFHTARLSWVALSCCCVHIARWIGNRRLSPAHTLRFWPRFGRLRQILKILKKSYNPRLKSVFFDRWFDTFTDSLLMAVAIKFMSDKILAVSEDLTHRLAMWLFLWRTSNCLCFSRQAMVWINARDFF